MQVHLDCGRDHPTTGRAVSNDERSATLADAAVRVTRDGPVALVMLARPAKSNAMDGEVTTALLDALRSLSESGDVRAMVLTGDGRAFSAGGDIQTIREMGADRGVRDAILDKHQELFWAMNRLPFASVAAVNGAAVGAGVTLALLCDLVVMAQDAFLCRSARRTRPARRRGRNCVVAVADRSLRGKGTPVARRSGSERRSPPARPGQPRRSHRRNRSGGPRPGPPAGGTTAARGARGAALAELAYRAGGPGAVRVRTG